MGLFVFVTAAFFAIGYELVRLVDRGRLSNRMRWIGGVIVGILLLAIVGALGGTPRVRPVGIVDGSPSALASASPTASPSPTASVEEVQTPETTPSVTPEPTPTIEPTDSPEPTATEEPAPALAFRQITIKGHGSRVVRFKIPADVSALAKITEKGSSNFVVWAIDESGAQSDLLVNEIGSYSGTRLFDKSSHSIAFKVESNGTWTIVIQPIELARPWNGSGTVKGKGDSVLLVTEPPSGLAVVKVTHRGSSNFAVWAYSDTNSELLINEIGRYSGETILPDGTVLIEIEADGAWTILME